MTAILIEFPVFDEALVEGPEAPMSKPRSATSSHGGRVRNVAQQTKLPPRKTPGNRSLGLLVSTAKAVLDYYGPVIEELATETQERDLFHHLEGALAPFLREAASRGGPLTRPAKTRGKLHIMPKPAPAAEPKPDRMYLPFSLPLYEDGSISGYFIEELRTVMSEELFATFMGFLAGSKIPFALNPATGHAQSLALAWDVELFFEGLKAETVS